LAGCTSAPTPDPGAPPVITPPSTTPPPDTSGGTGSTPTPIPPTPIPPTPDLEQPIRDDIKSRYNLDLSENFSYAELILIRKTLDDFSSKVIDGKNFSDIMKLSAITRRAIGNSGWTALQYDRSSNSINLAPNLLVGVGLDCCLYPLSMSDPQAGWKEDVSQYFPNQENVFQFVFAHELGEVLFDNDNRAQTNFRVLPPQDSQFSRRNQGRGPNDFFADAVAAFLYAPDLSTTTYNDFVKHLY
jgi:hypothetical protein